MRRATTALALSLCLTSAGLLGRLHSAAAVHPADDKTIAHVLNRVGFGPRPDDMARVREIGIERFIDEQLRPDHIADSKIEARLQGLSTLRMSSGDMASQFEMPMLEARRDRRSETAARDPGAQPGPTPEMRQQAARPVLELSEQKLLRAVYSERQLQEVLTDFWFNHFNVDSRKGQTRYLVTEYERDAIRPHVLGSFRDLLAATAKSPAMLFYLDNWLNADPHAADLAQAPPRPGRFDRFGPGRPFGQPAAAAKGKRATRGLNENYARELMELHTLGVDGGYTQQDVTEVARAFTGWTINGPRQGGGFRFDARLHDNGEKVVLGRRIKAGAGQGDGEQVLDILASHPSTARFIATKLARRFVNDTPPPSLVDRAASRFRDTRGDLREVVRTILMSPEFYGPGAYRAKVKTPLEFLVSALRATGAETDNAASLVRTLQQLGMPPYQCQPPTGYQDGAETWLNAGALVNRMNAALSLTQGDLPGVSVGDHSILGSFDRRHDLDVLRGRMVASMLGNDASATTLAAVSKAESASQMAALVLGSPEFQKR
jgi:uncharacterized protein (DUF1800 family)